MLPAAVIVGTLILLVLAVSYYSYRMAFCAKAKNPTEYKLKLPEGEIYQREYERAIAFITVLNEIDYEKVKIKSRDGTTLAARYYHVADGAPLHIEFHGYRSRATTDFCGINTLVRDLGHNTLLVDQRAHGESGGKTISFGIKERLDCLDWINYALDRFGKDITLVPDGDGHFRVYIRVAVSPNFLSWIMGFGSNVTVISPQSVIDEVKALAENVLLSYR